MSGAEKLVGKGDMLFNPLGSGKPKRIQGPFISDEEVKNVIDFVKAQVEDTEIFAAMCWIPSSVCTLRVQVETTETRKMNCLPEAIEVVVQAQQASVSMLQRRFRIGYNRAARIIDMMEEQTDHRTGRRKQTETGVDFRGGSAEHEREYRGY